MDTKALVLKKFDAAEWLENETDREGFINEYMADGGSYEEAHQIAERSRELHARGQGHFQKQKESDGV